MSDKKAAYRQGVWVAVVLGALTALEYWISIALDGSLVFLTLIGLVKAGIIVQYFMHIYRVWQEDSH